MHKLFLILFFLPLSCGKKDTVTEKPGILTLREMSDLATVEYTVTKVIKASDHATWFKMGDRKILMSCEAHIKAGIDMSTINSNNFVITGKNIEVRLPQPKVISVSIPAESIRTEYEEVGVFRDKFKTQDRDALAAQAEQHIIKSIDSLGIINQAKVNTSMFVTDFLQKLGYENIKVYYNDNWFKNKMQ
jgi:hypothetical protein